MKSTITAALLILALVSCKKEDPRPHEVVYRVTCKQCLVYVDDNTWNKSNKQQHFNVSGDWRYSFVPKDRLDSLYLRVHVNESQSVIVNVSYGKNTAGFGKIMESYSEKVLSFKIK